VSDELGTVLRANDVRVDRTVHNALAVQAERPAADAVAAFRARHGLGAAPVLAIGGRLHEQKGILQLFRMLAVLGNEFPDLRLLVLGERDLYEREFAARARALGGHARVVPTGWLDGAALPCADAAADVFVTPSICFDSVGLVNLEAMEHAKPVVATVFGGSREVVLDGRTGFLANPFDVPAFAEAIAKLLRDPGLAARLGAAGRARVLERFTIERLTAEFLEEYALAGRARGRESLAPEPAPRR
jgi:phosphatidylinositol alpha-1,6-mannosyltransferase